MHTILLIGEDPDILARRAILLESSGVDVSCCSASELSLYLAGDFDLVILCHTLEPHVLRSLVMSDVYRRWPRTPVLQVVIGEGALSTETGVDTRMSLVEPSDLVRLAERLLGKAPQLEWHRLSEIRPMSTAA